MSHVRALYRYPIKGFTPEQRDALEVGPDGRIVGDRLFAVRFRADRFPETRGELDYWPKGKGLSLQDFPALAALRLAYDDASGRVTVTHHGSILVDAVLEPAGWTTGADDRVPSAGNAAFIDAITDYLMASPQGRLLKRAGRLPLALVGDGAVSRFQDRPAGYVTVHSEASRDALSDALGQAMDDRRFRSNIVIDGVAANAELEWQAPVTIGALSFDPAGAIVRCLATHANPDTGERDASVLKALTGALGLPEPTLGRLLLPVGFDGAGVAPGATATGFSGGTISVGDAVRPA